MVQEGFTTGKIAIRKISVAGEENESGAAVEEGADDDQRERTHVPQRLRR